MRRGRRKLKIRVWLKNAWEGGKGFEIMEKGRGVEIGIRSERLERAEERDWIAGRRVEVEIEGEKSSPTAIEEIEVMNGRMERATNAEAEEGDAAKAKRRGFGTVRRMFMLVELRAARRGIGGLERRMWVICWERRKLERAFGGRKEETLLFITRPTKGGSFFAAIVALLVLLEIDAVERES